MSRRPRTTGRASVLACVAACGLAASGCFGNETTRFPEGLEPLEDDTAPPPDPTADDPYPEMLRMVHGSTGYDWVHGRGYVHASVARTWEALRDPEVDVDSRKVQEWSVTSDVEQGYDYSYKIHNVSHDIITVEFDITWRHGVVEGSLGDPSVVGIRYQKTWGTEFIDLLTGSIVLRPVDDETTELEIVEHLDAAAGSGADQIQSYFRDTFADVVAYVHDQPRPTY